VRRAALCGGAELIQAATVLGLVDTETPEIVLVDARSPEALERASAFPPSLPRVVIADAAEAPLFRALGLARVAASCSPAELGPLVAAALPPLRQGGTRLIAFTGARGGVGRTLLAVNLATRLLRVRPLWLVDATGTGSAAWWVRAETRRWEELEPLATELSIEHLRIVAAEPQPGLRVLGGAGAAPSAALLDACVAALRAEDDPILLDAPLLADERMRRLRASCDRVLVLSYDDPASRAALDAQPLADTWLIASQARSVRGDPPFRALPRDEAAVSAALSGPSPVGRRLGRAYDGLAELLAIDIS
jgi:hypothetical protein